MAMNRLPSLRIASPCPERWDEMTGDERARTCAKCNIPVHDIAALTSAEAEALLARRATERLCIRVTHRRDGSVITKDRPVRWFVPPAEAASARVEGTDAIVAPPEVQRAMRDAGETQLLAVLRVFIGVDGDVTEATLARSSGHVAFDKKLVDTIRSWRYRPFWKEHLGRAVETMTTVSYSLDRPPPSDV